MLLLAYVAVLVLMKPSAGACAGHAPVCLGSANGYEDYLKAADAVEDGRFAIYAFWSPKQFEDLKKSYADAQPAERSTMRPRLELASDLSELDFLGVQAAEVERYGGAIDLLKAGNLKQVYEPRKDITAETAFPEYSGFKNLARLMVASAYLEFAAGKAGDGADRLLDALRFTGHFCTDSTLMAELVSVASRSIVLSGFDTHLGRIPVKAWQDAIEYCDAALSETPGFARCLTLEQARFDKALPGSDPALLAASLQSQLITYPQASQAVGRLSVSDLQRVASEGASLIDQDYSAKIAAFNGPESDWFKLPDGSSRDLEDVGNPSIEQLVQRFHLATSSMLSAAGLAYERSRTQLRLLRLHARIQIYRWSNNRLPAILSLAATEQEIEDPFSGAKFIYRLIDDSHYRLYSSGRGSVGQIDLLFRNPLPSQVMTQGPPEPLSEH